MKATYVRKTVPVRRLLPNPFRRMHEYTIIREKVDALKESIAQTGFWGTIVGRETEDGVQIAFGHHRMIALQETHNPGDEVEINVRDLTNEQMLKMMARENMEEWGTSAWVEMETIRATIDGYGKGLIQLPAIRPRTNEKYIRYAPAPEQALPYTMYAVASFLGLMKKNGSEVFPNAACQIAFDALDMIDEGLLQETTIKGLKRAELSAIVGEVRRQQEAERRVAEDNRIDAQRAKERAAAAKSHEERQRYQTQATVYAQQAVQHEKNAHQKAQDFGKQAAAIIHEGGGVIGVKRRSNELKAIAHQTKPTLNMDEYAGRVSMRLSTIAYDDELSEDFKYIKRNIRDLSPDTAERFGRAIDGLVARLQRMKAALNLPNESHLDVTEVNGHVGQITDGRS